MIKNWGLAFVGLLAFSSCQSGGFPSQSNSEPKIAEFKNVEELPESEVMDKVERIAILPFIDHSRSVEHNLNFSDLTLFGELFASHLTGSQTFKGVMYPQDVLRKLEGSQLSLLRQDDLKEIGNLLEVDGLVFGIINQYNMYHPPKLSLSMKFYLTRAERFATINEISILAHVGMPINQYNPTFFRQLWDKSAYYDGKSNHVRDMIEHMQKTNSTDSYGMDGDRFLRTKRDFLDLIAYDLADSLDCSKHEEANKFVAPPSLKGKKTSYVPSGYYHR